jgi:hypothetical protein
VGGRAAGCPVLLHPAVQAPALTAAAPADVHKLVRGLLLGLQVQDIQQEVDLQ